MRRGKSLRPFSDEDASELYHFPETQFLRINVEGSEKEPSYRQLSLYWSSCSYIANMNLSNDLNTKDKVHYLTRIWCDFTKESVFDQKTGLLHWRPRSISYTNCHQKTRQDYITKALEEHAQMIGIFDVKKYKKLLESQ